MLLKISRPRDDLRRLCKIFVGKQSMLLGFLGHYRRNPLESRAIYKAAHVYGSARDLAIGIDVEGGRKTAIRAPEQRFFALSGPFDFRPNTTLLRIIACPSKRD